MEKIKVKAIELILDIISKEDFEMRLYEKVKTEDLIKNKFLFDLVNINYRKEDFKKLLLEILEKEINEEVLIIYKIHYYSRKIKDEKDSKIILTNFNKIYDLFEFDLEYGLMWEFYGINVKLDLVEIGYENESDIIKDLKKLCFSVCSEFDKLLTLKEKGDFLINGFKTEEIEKEQIKKEEKQQVKQKIVPLKKWFEFWK